MDNLQERAAQLTEIARSIRCETLKSIHRAGSGHPGGSLSAVDIMTALYFEKMKIDPEYPADPNRDRFLLSKGHAAPALYATLAMRGYFPLEELQTLRQIGSRLSGHPACFKLPGVEITSGSLGQGLSMGLGLSLAARITQRDYRVFVLLGDGELQEGQVWEAAMAAAHFRARNLIAIVDYNGVQLDGPVAEIMDVAPLADKWSAFGWRVLEVDGHSMVDLLPCLDDAIAESASGPVVIIAHTVKGKGVSFMEHDSDWHGQRITDDDLRNALAELSTEGGGLE